MLLISTLVTLLTVAHHVGLVELAAVSSHWVSSSAHDISLLNNKIKEKSIHPPVIPSCVDALLSQELDGGLCRRV